MQYLDPIQQKPKAEPQPQQGGAYKFHGNEAEIYDADREDTDKWRVEQKIIEDWLSELPEGTRIIDAPVGTGRFLRHMIDRKLQFVGIDIQFDMRAQAALKILPREGVEHWVEQCNAQGGRDIPLRIKGHGLLMKGDVLKLPLEDKSADVAIACRITRWMMGNHGPDGICTMLREFQRVTRSKIILTARVYGKKVAVTEDLINSALSGWKITRNVAGYELPYRIIMLEPA